MAEVNLRGVVKRYAGSVEAVKGLDLDLPDGQFTVLVGPSGCGKTTTLRMIAGLESVTEGRIDIGGTDVTNLEPKDRDVSMVFQNYALYPHLSVRENMAFPMRARGIDQQTAYSRVAEVADILGVTQLLERKPAALSGGQQQRVAIGRAIVRQPQVFLFDEPLSNLDAKLRVEMRTEILRLQRRLGVTALYVTHDQEEAMTLSDVMVVMKDGVIAQMGSPATIYNEPASTFVASFVGSPKMNLIAGVKDGSSVVTSAGLTCETHAGGRGDVVCGIRPEDILLAAADEGTSSNSRVEIIELLGPRAIVSLDCSGEKVISVVDSSDLVSIHEGMSVAAKIRPNSAHIFDVSSGLRLSS